MSGYSAYGGASLLVVAVGLLRDLTYRDLFRKQGSTGEGAGRAIFWFGETPTHRGRSQQRVLNLETGHS